MFFRHSILITRFLEVKQWAPIAYQGWASRIRSIRGELYLAYTPRHLCRVVCSVAHWTRLLDRHCKGALMKVFCRSLTLIAERRRNLKPPKSQELGAHAAGISVRHYQKLVSASIDPRLSTMLNVAEALGTSLQTLLDSAKLERYLLRCPTPKA